MKAIAILLAWLLLVTAAAADDALLLAFTADGCQSCQQMKPTIDRLVERNYNVQRVDCERDPTMAGFWKVDGVPAYVLVRGGHEVARISGPASELELVALFDRTRPASRGHEHAVGKIDERTYATANFVCKAPSADLAREICHRAEACRKEQAIDWLGESFGDWSEPCRITADVGIGVGNGGATNFVFQNGEVFGWTMRAQGNRERMLDSVIPHEVLHTVFATHFRRPLPRWADEGAATSIEHASERNKHRRTLITALKTNRGISFAQMFAMREYPDDVLPLYAQGHSLTTFLVNAKGKRHFVNYIERGLERDQWGAATKEAYGCNLGELQNTWLEWIKAGSPSEATERTANCCFQRFLPWRRAPRPGPILPARPAPVIVAPPITTPPITVAPPATLEPIATAPAAEAPSFETLPGPTSAGDATPPAADPPNELEAPAPAPRETKPAPPATPSTRSIKGVIVDTAGNWLSTKAIAIAAGFGIPGWAVAVAIWLAKRRLKNRLEAPSDPGPIRPAPAPSTPPACCGKPVEMRDRHHNHYVDVDRPETDHAWSKAHRLVADKYPGAATYLKTAERIKNLILAGDDTPDF